MRPPRFRFTVRRMMVAMAVLGIALAVEIRMAQYAINLAGEGRDGVCHQPTTAGVAWFGLNFLIFLGLDIVRHIAQFFGVGVASIWPAIHGSQPKPKPTIAE